MPRTDEDRQPGTTPGTEPTPVGTLPQLGHVPATTNAAVLRSNVAALLGWGATATGRR